MTPEEKVLSNRASNKKWRDAHPGYSATKSAAWYAAHPGYSTERSADRYAAMRARVDAAMAQDVATRRKVEELT